MSERLCAVCNRIFTDPTPVIPGHRYEWGRIRPHHSKLGDFLQAANEGCYICRSITKSYKWSDISYLSSKGFPFTFKTNLDGDDQDPFGSGLLNVNVIAYYEITDDDSRLRFNQAIEDLNEIKGKWLPRRTGFDRIRYYPGLYHFYFYFHLRPIEDSESYALQPEKSNEIGSKRKIEDNVIDLRCSNSEAAGGCDHLSTPFSVLGDQSMMDLLKYWITDCSDNHPLCHPPTPSFSPTRLLFIENEHSARVVETKDWAIDHPYVALSHCWGNTNRLKLQKGNMVDLFKHVSITELPTTYKEGISVTLALGFSYIWIDSLCIIQNDEDDWTKEAATMKDVFEHCYINLSATAAPDGSHSNFGHRDPAIIPPLEVTFNQGEKKPIQSKFRLTTDWTQMRRHDVICSPLHSRAWVFQEANLSRRRIDLARSQMWWLCQQNWACETHPSGVWDVGIYMNDDCQQYWDMRKRRDVDHNAPLTISSLTGPNSETPNPMVYSNTSPKDYQRCWHEQIQLYSNCAITKTKDRLIAFAGIAQSYAQGLGRSLDDYLAGIWRQELPHSLCFSSSDRKPSYRPDGYRAPSWTWTSLEGPVFWRARGKPKPSKPLCEIVNAKVIHQFERCHAAGVTGGVLHLRGRLVERVLGSQVPKWPNDKWIEGLTDAEVDDDDFDECWNVRDSKTPHPRRLRVRYLEHPRPLRVSYLEHPQGQLDQRKEGIVDGAVRKSVSVEKLDQISEHLRLFMLPIIEGETHKLTGTDVECLILCQTLDDCLAGNDIYQRVGFYDRSLTSWNEGFRVSLEDLLNIPVRDVYII